MAQNATRIPVAPARATSVDTVIPCPTLQHLLDGARSGSVDATVALMRQALQDQGFMRRSAARALRSMGVDVL